MATYDANGVELTPAVYPWLKDGDVKNGSERYRRTGEQSAH